MIARRAAVFGRTLTSQFGAQAKKLVTRFLPESQPHQYQQSVDELPLVDIEHSHRLVCAALASLKQEESAVALRFNGIETWREPADYLIASCYRQFVGETGGVRKLKVKWLHKAQQLLLTLVEAYLSLLYDTSSKLESRQAALAVYRAIHYLNEIQLGCYRFYTTPPAVIWSKVHHLFEYAEVEELSDIQLSFHQRQTTKESSIREAYCAGLLLSLANPYQLQKNDIDQVFQLLNGTVKSVRLTPSRSESLFAWDPNSDKPPYFRKLQESVPAHHRGLDTTTLVQQLKQALASVPDKVSTIAFDIEGQEPMMLTRALVKHLIRAWGTFPTRAFPRSACDNTVRTCVGLSATHYFISEGSDLRSVLTDEELAALDESVYYKAHQWKLVNSSLNGYCVCLTEDIDDVVCVGEIIGLQEVDNEGTYHWYVGTIRWIRYDEKDEVQIGIQLLSPSAQPVSIQNRRQKNNGASFLRALLLPEIPSLEQVSTVITPNYIYQKNEPVRIFNETLDMDIALKRIVDSRSKYVIYEYDVLKNTAVGVHFKDH
jgi:cyclic-di-GMP-binding protein